MEFPNTVLLGHVINQLRRLPEGSVQCVVTSPPYWGLRAYGTEPQIWPDSKPLCEKHEWATTPPRRKRASYDVKNPNSKQSTNLGSRHTLFPQNVCLKCNAWRGELGLEPTPELYVQHIVEIFREVKRVLRKDGTLWLNMGDSYAGSGKAGSNPEYQKRHTEFGKLSVHSERFGLSAIVPNGLKPKDLVGIPWMVAFALRADGWWLRSEIIWHKPNPMPESVMDRPTRAHEYVFLLTKSQRYYYDGDAISEEGAQNKWGKYSNPKYGKGTGGKMQSAKDMSKEEYLERYQRVNKRSVWTITTKPFDGAHFATFPADLVEPCVRAGSKEGDVVLDPFAGSGTTLEVAARLGRGYIGIELQRLYVEDLIRPRLARVSGLFNAPAGEEGEVETAMQELSRDC